MQVLLWGNILQANQGNICLINVGLTSDGMVELEFDGSEGQKITILVDFELLEHAVKSIRSAPDYEDSSIEELED